MLTIAIVLFALAALGGAFMGTRIRAGELPPMGVALVHGAAAATGLVLLLVTVLDVGGGGGLAISLALFVGAALGGFALFAMHLKRKPQPLGLVVVHAAVAVTAFVILLVARFG